MVLGRRNLERQAAVLSKSQSRLPVVPQRAAQQCLSQHINNSYMLVCVCIHKCVHTITKRCKSSYISLLYMFKTCVKMPLKALFYVYIGKSMWLHLFFHASCQWPPFNFDLVNMCLFMAVTEYSILMQYWVGYDLQILPSTSSTSPSSISTDLCLTPTLIRPAIHFNSTMKRSLEKSLYSMLTKGPKPEDPSVGGISPSS